MSSSNVAVFLNEFLQNWRDRIVALIPFDGSREKVGNEIQEEPVSPSGPARNMQPARNMHGEET